MAWISMPRRLTSMWPDVEFFKLNREPADVDRVSVAREVAEDRGPFCGCGDGRRADRGGSGAGARFFPHVSGRTRLRSRACPRNKAKHELLIAKKLVNPGTPAAEVATA